jgi:hypothetical protein
LWCVGGGGGGGGGGARFWGVINLGPFQLSYCDFFTLLQNLSESDSGL